MSASTRTLSVVATAIANDLRLAPKVARQLGFTGLQLPLVFGSVDLTQLSGTGLRDVRQLLATHEQQLVAISADLGPKGFGPGADVDRLLKRLADAMQVARGLTAGLLTVDLGPLPQPERAAKPAPKVEPGMAGLILLPTASELAAIEKREAPPATTDSAFFSQVDAALVELGRMADRTGVTLALRCDLSSYAALERALKAASCPWFGIDLDPVALLRDEWEPDEVFSRLGELIRHVRVRDAVGGSGGRTRPAIVGQGDTSWPELLARLEASGYHGAMTIDPTELPDRTRAAVVAFELFDKLPG
ncbi:sugar phosphate isomerase/epimerase family protein [Humisphaera borealis]|uniref:TIM barrel protein n=1 Tax=Humisphaera borealis TaxID=2807512 RepID=A0A7M2WYF5_9BACT|nr:TIM barrel protein [Humisphaera borealis]QOV90528.1 TIM barrel protein [Humisphaera borealis]